MKYNQSELDRMSSKHLEKYEGDFDYMSKAMREEVQSPSEQEWMTIKMSEVIDRHWELKGDIEFFEPISLMKLKPGIIKLMFTAIPALFIPLLIGCLVTYRFHIQKMHEIQNNMYELVSKLSPNSDNPTPPVEE